MKASTLNKTLKAISFSSKSLENRNFVWQPNFSIDSTIFFSALKITRRLLGQVIILLFKLLFVRHHISRQCLTKPFLTVGASIFFGSKKKANRWNNVQVRYCPFWDVNKEVYKTNRMTQKSSKWLWLSSKNVFFWVFFCFQVFFNLLNIPKRFTCQFLYKLHFTVLNFMLFYDNNVFWTFYFLHVYLIILTSLKLRCDERFTHAFTACGCVFKDITFVWANQGNYFENATTCSKRTLKTTVATQW